MIRLNDIDFELIEKYIVTRGDSWNDDRCFELPVEIGKHEELVTLCADEILKQIKICQLNGADNYRNDKKELILKKIIKEAFKATYNKKQEDDWKYYLKYAKQECKCCKYNCAICRFYTDK